MIYVLHKRIKPKHRLWHKWFAWYPVFLEDAKDYAWLETVWRIAERESSDTVIRWVYQLDIVEKR